MPHGSTGWFRDYVHLARLFYGGTAFVAVDTETTGLRCQCDYLTEVGAVRFTAGGVTGTFDRLIKPPVSIPQRLVELTGITDQMVEHCPAACEVLPEFMAFAEGACLVAHNAPFDLGFLNAELERMDRPCISAQVIDTLHLAKWAYPQFAKEPAQSHYGLQTLAKRFGIPVHAAHRAHDDARVCMELLLRILADTEGRQKDFVKGALPLF